MKLQLDTTAKTVKIENDIKVSLLIKTLKSLLPNDWKDFTLLTNTTITTWAWTNAIVINPCRPWYEAPWYYTTSTSLTGDTHMKADYSLKAGVFDVEL